MLTRRSFVQAAAASVAAQAFGQTQAPALRTISYNVLACIGFPNTPANRWRLNAAREQMEARMAQELLLYAPDIISFSESVTRPAAERLAKLLGMQFAYFPPGVPSYPGYPIGFPGTVFTRYRIVESENAPFGGASADPALFTRHWGRAVIDTGRERIAFFSGHMHPNKADIRDREMTIMLDVMRKAMDSGVSVLFQGDLNHTPDAPEHKRWTDAGLIDAFEIKGTGDGFTFNSVEPKRRIDYIWVHGPLAKRLHESRVLNEGAFRTNREDPQSFAHSDHLPIMAAFDKTQSAVVSLPAHVTHAHVEKMLIASTMPKLYFP
jgi:endonuclease/exonuclease/phosphatase family metal-dependent hydrolase